MKATEGCENKRRQAAKKRVLTMLSLTTNDSEDGRRKWQKG